MNLRSKYSITPHETKLWLDPKKVKYPEEKKPFPNVNYNEESDLKSTEVLLPLIQLGKLDKYVIPIDLNTNLVGESSGSCLRLACRVNVARSII